MTTPAVQQILAAAAAALRSGNLAAADAALAPFFRGALLPSPDLLNIAGTLRLQQGRLADAVGLFDQAARDTPHDPVFTFNLGLTLSRGLATKKDAGALRPAR